MNETDGPDRDEELDRARLRELDPAASLAPADPVWVARLLEDTMSHDVDTPRTHESRENGTHGRSPLTWLVAAAAILVIAGVGVFATMWQEDGPDNPPSAAPSSTQGPSVLELSARPAVAAKCMVPTAEILANQQTAFDGTVASITDGVVTLDVTHWYLGGPADQVTVDRTARGDAGAGPGRRLPGRPALPRLGQRRVRHRVRLHRGHRRPAAMYARRSGLTSTGERRLRGRGPPSRLKGRVTLHGLLLAAGAGSRMGTPKALVVDDDGTPWLPRRGRAPRRRLRTA